MNVTADVLAALTTNYRVIFQQGLGGENPQLDAWRKLVTIFDSTTDKETYNWLGEHPGMEEWKDKRIIKALRDWNYTLTNKHYEVTLGIDRDTIEDDKFGLYAPRIRNLAIAARKFYNEKVFTQLDDGETLLAYDGNAFFHDTRTIGDSGTIDNILSGNYSDSATEIRAGVAAAVEAMAGYKDDHGKYLNLVPDTIVCNAKMFMPIVEALRADYAGAQRTEAGFVKEVIQNPWIDADTDDWFFLCTTAEVKPIIFQNRKNPEFVPLDRIDDSFVFMAKQFLYGVDSRFEVGFGDPRTAILMHNT